jgi:hypothetical protein
LRFPRRRRRRSLPCSDREARQSIFRRCILRYSKGRVQHKFGSVCDPLFLRE